MVTLGELGAALGCRPRWTAQRLDGVRPACGLVYGERLSSPLSGTWVEQGAVIMLATT